MSYTIFPYLLAGNAYENGLFPIVFSALPVAAISPLLIAIPTISLSAHIDV